MGIVSRPPTINPGQGWAINWGHPLAKGLAICIVAAPGGFIDLISNRTFKPITSAGLATKRGYGTQNTSNTGAAVCMLPMQPAYPNSAITMASGFVVGVPFNIEQAVGSWNANSTSSCPGDLLITSANIARFEFWNSGGTSAQVLGTSTTPAGAYADVVGTYSTVDGNAYLYVNGNNEGTTNLAGTGIAANGAFGLFSNYPNAGSNYSLGNHSIAYFFQWNDRRLTAAEVAQLYANPYQILMPVRRMNVAALAGGATHSTTGAATGSPANVAGASNRFHGFGSTGASVGGGSNAVGAASRLHAFGSTGVAVGTGANVTGASARLVSHSSTGAATNPGAVVAGAASRSTGATTHGSTGSALGTGSLVAGLSARFRTFTNTGSATGGLSSVAGSANRFHAFGATAAAVAGGANATGVTTRFRAFGNTGAALAGGANVAGAAARSGAAVTHTATGSVVAGGASVFAGSSTGTASNQIFNSPIWHPWGKKRHRRETEDVIAALPVVVEAKQEIAKAETQTAKLALDVQALERKLADQIAADVAQKARARQEKAIQARKAKLAAATERAALLTRQIDELVAQEAERDRLRAIEEADILHVMRVLMEA